LIEIFLLVFSLLRFPLFFSVSAFAQTVFPAALLLNYTNRFSCRFIPRDILRLRMKTAGPGMTPMSV
jgi:hypothetical protein